MKFATFGHPPSSVQQAAIVPSALASFDRLWAQIAVIGISTSFCNAIVYYPLRSGLENPHLLIPSCILVVTAALLAPLLLPYRGLMSDLRWRTVAMPILTFAVLGSVVFALVTQSFLFIFYVAICLVGASRAIQLLRPEGLANFIFCIFTGGLIGLYLFCTVQSLNYAGLYSPEQALLGTLNHDTTFHSALAFMIQNYGVPSIGMDGIVPLKYHFGSHFWFAGLGRLAATEPLFSYGAGVPIVLAPMLITSLFLSGASVDQGQRPLAGYLLIGIALVLLSDNIGWQSYYISESYTCGLIGLLLLLPLLASLASEQTFSRQQQLMAFALAIAAIPLLVVLKISVGALWTAALGYLLLRRYGFGIRSVLIGAATSAVFLLVLWKISPAASDYKVTGNSIVVPFYFFRRMERSSFSSFVIPIILLLSQTRLYGGPGLVAMAKQRSNLMIEAMIVMLVLGSIPPILGIPQDSAVWYFLNVAQWMAIALLIAQDAPKFSVATNVIATRALPLIFSLAFVLMLTLYYGVYQQALSVVNAADKKANGQLLNTRSVSQYFREALSREHVMWDRAFRAIVANNVGEQITQTVRKQLPSPDRNTAVFIPPENTAFWSLHNGCHERFNTQVALTGQPSLLGGPPESYGCDSDVYTSDYGSNFKSKDLSDTALCDHAKMRHIQRVLIIGDGTMGGRNRMLDCK